MSFCYEKEMLKRPYSEVVSVGDTLFGKGFMFVSASGTKFLSSRKVLKSISSYFNGETTFSKTENRMQTKLTDEILQFFIHFVAWNGLFDGQIFFNTLEDS